MKNFIFFLIIWLFLQTASAQEYQYVPFPDSNAVWSEVYWKPFYEPAPRWVYNQYALFNEDTIINGIVYHKLFHTNASEITRENSECIGVIKEDNMKHIWFKDFNESHEYSFLNKYGEMLLYRFDLNINDTIRNSEDFTNIVGVDYLILIDVDTIQIGNIQRKIYTFSDIPWEIWIEGIGKIKGLHFPSGDLPTNGLDNDLVCMHQNDTLIFYNSGPHGIYDDCVPQFVLNGVSLFPNTEIKVYPNPATYGFVYFENLDFETLELYDISGNLVQEEDISGVGFYQLNVSQYTKGVYLYRLKTKGLVPTGGRLVIQ
jgi:hypothetical protein